MTRVNTTVFQEVSSKVSGLFGKMFGKKNKRPVVVDKVLSPEFLRDLNLQTAPDVISPKSSNYRNKEPMSTKNNNRKLW